MASLKKQETRPLLQKLVRFQADSLTEKSCEKLTQSITNNNYRNNPEIDSAQDTEMENAKVESETSDTILNSSTDSKSEEEPIIIDCKETQETLNKFIPLPKTTEQANQEAEVEKVSNNYNDSLELSPFKDIEVENIKDKNETSDTILNSAICYQSEEEEIDIDWNEIKERFYKLIPLKKIIDEEIQKSEEKKNIEVENIKDKSETSDTIHNSAICFQSEEEIDIDWNKIKERFFKLIPLKKIIDEEIQKSEEKANNNYSDILELTPSEDIEVENIKDKSETSDTIHNSAICFQSEKEIDIDWNKIKERFFKLIPLKKIIDEEIQKSEEKKKANNNYSDILELTPSEDIEVENIKDENDHQLLLTCRVNRHAKFRLAVFRFEFIVIVQHKNLNIYFIVHCGENSPESLTKKGNKKKEKEKRSSKKTLKNKEFYEGTTEHQGQIMKKDTE
ncbi:putative pre-mRNA-splicing factor ATP-dependent RNA helicase DHX16 [Parasteatoda tepidariorum]|uniref:putative pre-mRNA-splicing factor ATP-dependent RNA helicase DHX16 n=1 Tax=Parasteatoda tepidariorum TaxID=114398 RepID=UPI0039BD7CAF